MPEEILERQEAEEIARRFTHDHWNARETVIEAIKFTLVGDLYIYDIEGSVIYSRPSSPGPSEGFFFTVQVSAKNGKVLGSSTQPFPPSQPIMPEDIISPPEFNPRIDLRRFKL